MQLSADKTEVCYVNKQFMLEYSQTLNINIKQGNNAVFLDCNINTPSVISLPVIGIDSILTGSNNDSLIDSLRSNQNSYLLSPGKQLIRVEFIAEQAGAIKLRLNDFAYFHSVSMLHNTVMSLYIGLCISLAIFVGLLGRGIKRSGFNFYAIYLISIAIFFGIQEGVFNYFSFELPFLHTRSAQLIFAGIVVFTATLFISRLLDFKLLINDITSQFLTYVSASIMTLGIFTLFIPVSITNLLSAIMGWSTLVLVFTIFCIAGFAAINKVHTASLVVIALSTVLFGMIFRIWLTDLSDFLNRYALIIATAIESLIFAFAASEKVRYLGKANA